MKLNKFGLMENIKHSENSNTVESAIKILFVICCIFAGVAIHFGSKKYHYPYTVGCFLFGVIIGFIEINSSFMQNFTAVARMNPSDMLLTFLPILIFESSFGMDAYMFYKALPQCLFLAVVGFLFCTALTAVFAVYALQVYNWSWLTAFLFGSIISATDPVAVVALLRDMKMPHSFTILIEGESLLNDGVAIVLYDLLSELMESNKSFKIGESAIKLLKTCVGAPIFGYVIGKIAEWILTKIYISPVSEMTMTIVFAYVSYFVAESFLGISAILAVVIYGITFGANKMCISPESEGLIHTDWRLLSVYANTLIFMFVGILVVVNTSEHFTPTDAWLIVVTYIALTLFRSVMIALFYPILKRTGYGLNWKESIILSWGGLRGAIGLALSLMIVSNPHIPASSNANKVLVQVSGIIVLTLIVNANTVKYIMKVLSLKKITLVNRLSMGNAMATALEMKEKSLRICKDDWKLMKANWDWVARKTKLKDPYAGGLYGDDPDMCSLFVPYGTCSECITAVLPYTPSSEELCELEEAARKKVLTALKGNLWRQFRKGCLQRRSLKLLCAAADCASDTPDKYLRCDEVKKNFMKVSKCSHWLETKLSQIKQLKQETTDYDLGVIQLQKSDTKGFRNFCSKIYFSVCFEPLIFAIIILSIIDVSIHIFLISNSNFSYYKLTMNYFAVFFICFFALEIIIKVFVLKWSLYKKSLWNKTDFFLSVLAIIDGTIDLILMQFPSLHTVPSHFRILVAFRLLKYYYVVVGIFFSFISMIRNHTSDQMYGAYDIGRGFLLANIAVLKNIDVIIDFKPCTKIPVSVCEKNIKEMLDALDELEKQYPAVVLALKSNRAARKILNRLKEVLDNLKVKSLILQEDVRRMKSIIFKMTKQVVFAPRVRPSVGNIQKILEEVDWINSDLAKEIYENHIIASYDTGETIQEEGLHHQHVFIIVTGIVKVIGEIKGKSSHVSEKLSNADSMLFFTDFGTSFVDYMTSPWTIGLLGFLQKSPSVTSVVCQKKCELIQIDFSFLKEALEKYDDLIFCMWRNIAMRISIHLLKKRRFYKSYTGEDLLLCLQKAILPDMSLITSWNIPSTVQDMVVIQGRIQNVMTQIEYSAPSYIPSSCRHIKLLDDVKTRPTVVILLLLNPKYSLHNSTNWLTPEEINDASFLKQVKKEK